MTNTIPRCDANLDALSHYGVPVTIHALVKKAVNYALAIVNAVCSYMRGRGEECNSNCSCDVIR